MNITNCVFELQKLKAENIVLRKWLESSDSIRHAEKEILIKEIEANKNLRERLARLVEAAESVKQYMLTGKWDAKCGHSPEFMLAQAIDAAESGKEESRG